MQTKQSHEQRIITLDFSDEIGRLTRNFVERRELFARVSESIRQNDSPFVLLTGEPGSGKSAFIAGLIRELPSVVAYHFCIARKVSTLRPATVIRSLASQLSRNLPGFAEALVESIKPESLTININIAVQNSPGAEITGMVIKNLATTNSTEDLEALIRAPLNAMKPADQPVAILIDGLDEALQFRADRNLVTLLGMIDDCPDWVKFICTTRALDDVLSHFPSSEEDQIRLDAEESRSAVETYVSRRVLSPKIASRLELASGISQAQLARAVLDRADGNFLYAVVVMDDVEDGRQPLDRVGELPPSLDGVYSRFLRRFDDDAWRNNFQPLIGKLTVAQEPLSESQLCKFSGIRPRVVRECLGSLQQYLEEIPNSNGGKFRLFHESFRDFLVDKDRSGRYWCDTHEEHLLISKFYLPEGDLWNDSDDYGRIHLPTHLNRCQRNHDLYAVLCNYGWIAAKLGVTSIRDVLVDYGLLPSDSHLRNIHALLRLCVPALTHDKDLLWSQLYSRMMEERKPLIDHFPPAPKHAWIRPLRPTLRQFDDPRLWALDGKGRVSAVAAVPNSSHVLSGSSEGSVTIWDVDSGQEIRTLRGHVDDVRAIAVSSDGIIAVTGSRDGIVIVWDLPTGRELRRWLEIGNKYVPTVAISDGKAKLAFEGPNRTVQIRDLNGEELQQIAVPEPVNAVAFIPHSSLLAVRANQLLAVVDIKSGQILHRFGQGGYELDTSALAVSRDGRLVASADGSNIRLLEVSSGKVSSIETDHRQPMTALAFDAEGRRLASSTWSVARIIDNTVKIWDLERKTCLATFEHDSSVNALVFSDDCRRVVSGTTSGRVMVWNVQGHSPAPPPHRGRVTGVSIPVHGNFAVSASIDATIRSWDLDSCRQSSFLESAFPVRSLDCNDDGSLILYSSSRDEIILGGSFFDDRIETWTPRGRKHTHILVEAGGDLIKNRYPIVRLRPGSQCAVMFRVQDGGYHGKPPAIEYWDLKQNRMRWNHEVHPSQSVNGMEVGRDDIFVAISSTVEKWHLQGYELSDKTSYAAHIELTALDFSATLRLVVIGDMRGNVRVLNQELESMLSWKAHDSPIRDLVILSGLGQVISISEVDLCLKVWDLKDGSLISSFFADDRLTSLASRADGKSVVVGDATGRLHFCVLAAAGDLIAN